MRLLAFTFLVCAAFDWPLPWLDRAGTAALGFAFLALASSPGASRLLRPARMNLSTAQTFGMDNTTNDVSDLVERISAATKP